MEKKKNENIQKELSECTFKPKINSSSYTRPKRMQSVNEVKYDYYKSLCIVQ